MLVKENQQKIQDVISNAQSQQQDGDDFVSLMRQEKELHEQEIKRIQKKILKLNKRIE